ncbi:MAG TPA: hypothetical protein V6C99_10200 [Oculatellaceae cyanobacterium]|jgi:hypothetical protein
MVYFGAISPTRFSGGQEPAPAKKYEQILQQAKIPAHAEAGEYTITQGPDGQIQIGRKDIQGFYGIVFRPDGSVTENRSPAQGGPKEVIPPGGFDFKKAKEALQRASQ